MTLPLKPPIEPQLARSRAALPVGEEWVYEPKYDGFRAIAFVDGEQCMIQSRSGKPLSRYFPELSGPLKEQLPARVPVTERYRGPIGIALAVLVLLLAGWAFALIRGAKREVSPKPPA